MDGRKIQVHIGSEGIPFLTQRSGVPDYKSALPGRLQPQHIRKARVDVLNLSDDSEFERYQKIWDAVGIGVATVVEEERHWVEASSNWKVFIRWYINSQMDPSELNAARLASVKEMVSPINGG